jgi:RNA polymerase sigma factor (sigma-70 family)
VPVGDDPDFFQRDEPLTHHGVEDREERGDPLGRVDDLDHQRQERQVQLALALDRLPADYREVIVLRNLEGLPHEEIARRMGRGTGAVRMLWVRALARLKQMLDEMPPGA